MCAVLSKVYDSLARGCRPHLEHKALAAGGVQHRLQGEVAQACVVGPALGHLREEAADALGGRSRHVDAPLHHEGLSHLDKVEERSLRPGILNHPPRTPLQHCPERPTQDTQTGSSKTKKHT